MNLIKDDVMSKSVDFVLDIETLGIKPGAPILSIGAICGDNAFYAVVYPRTGTPDPDTVQWWRSVPSQAARDHVFSPEVHQIQEYQLKDALTNLVDFIKENNPTCFWGCSPNFDYGHLEYWMTEYGIEIPWKFYQMRDVRTIRDFLSKTAVTALTEQYIEDDNKHIAVYDAYLEAQIIKYCRDHLTKSSDE